MVLNQSDVGRRIINFYYEEAPRIVEQIKKSEKKKEICDWIYNEIHEALKEFEKGRLNEAGGRYLLMMYQADLISANIKDIQGYQKTSSENVI